MRKCVVGFVRPYPIQRTIEDGYRLESLVGYVKSRDCTIGSKNKD